MVEGAPFHELWSRTEDKAEFSGAWWGTPLIPALGRQRQENLCEFEANLVYKASLRTVRAIHRKKSCLERLEKAGQ